MSDEGRRGRADAADAKYVVWVQPGNGSRWISSRPTNWREAKRELEKHERENRPVKIYPESFNKDPNEEK